MTARAQTAVLAAEPGTRATVTLDNGLRVVAQQVADAQVDVLLADFEVGIRDEAPGQRSFAHLFEHLMCTRATPEGVPHLQAVAALGGMSNGMTRLDHTIYANVVPSGQLARLLSLELRRLTETEIRAEHLDLERAVVRNEIADLMRNTPYGSFPWSRIGAACFSDHVHAHNDDGTFDDLNAATVADTSSFHRRFYRPDNALVFLGGPASPDELLAMARDTFSGWRLPPGPVLRQAGRYEPSPAPAAIEYGAPLIREPATALGYLMMPFGSAEFLAEFALASALTALLDGESGTTARAARAYVGLMDADGFTVRDPNLLVIEASGPRARAREVADRALRRIAGLGTPDIERLIRRAHLEMTLAWQWWGGRAMTDATVALLHAPGQALAPLCRQLLAMDADELRAAAERIARAVPGMVTVLPC